MGGEAHHRLAGRVGELATLEGELVRAGSGEFRVVLISGEAGAGKSRLTRQVLARAEAVESVLDARATSLEATGPFAVWAKALDRYLRSADPELLQQIGSAAPELSSVVRSLRSVGAELTVVKPRVHRMVEAVSTAIGVIAERGTVLVVLDDVHLAGAPSWEALYHLADDRRDSPVLLVVACRPSELAEHPVAADVVHALEQDDVLSRVELCPLGRDELTELAEDRLGREHVPGALVDWLEARSRGVPLYAVGLLQALQDEDADLARPSLSAVPETLRERVFRRVRDLVEPSRDVLDLLAVLDEPAEVADVARLAATSFDQVAVALDDLGRRGLVVHDDRTPRPSFEVAHPLVRDAIYAEIGAARRASIHGAVGRTLLASGRRGAGAVHLAHSTHGGDAAAVSALLDALGETEDQGLYREAGAVLSALVDILPAGDDRWLDALARMDPRAEWVPAHLIEDHLPQAIEAMGRIDDLVDADDDPLGAAVVQFRLGCFGLLARPWRADAHRACDRAEALFERAGRRDLALTARAERAGQLTHRGDPRASARFASDAAEAAVSLDDPLPLLHARAAQAWSLSFTGDADAGLHAARAGVREATTADNRYRRCHLLGQEANALARIGHIADAERALSAATSDAPYARDALVHETGVVVSWLAGDLGAARFRAARTAARNRLTVSTRQAPFLALGARCAVEADDLDGVEATLDECSTALEGSPGPWGIYSGWAWGVWAWRHGDPTCVDWLRAAAERAAALPAPFEAHWVLFDLAEAAADTGDVAPARWAADRAAEVGASLAPPLYDALRTAITALATRVGGEATDLKSLESAAHTLSGLGTRLFAGRALLCLAQAKEIADRDPVEDLEAAAKVFDESGAAWHRDRALGHLRSRGGRGRRVAAALTGPGTLTPREREVAHLAAGGRTAPEIAQALYIGRRTVETHLANAYAKLGVRSKRELVKRRSDLGI